MKKDNFDYIFYTLCFIVIVAITVAAFVVTDRVLHQDEDDSWDDFADSVNTYTDHQLETQRRDVGWIYTAGYIRFIGDDTSMKLIISNSSSSLSYTLTYCYVHCDDDCIRIEWYKVSSASSDEPVLTSVSYIPYTSITYVQANEVTV